MNPHRVPSCVNFVSETFTLYNLDINQTIEITQNMLLAWFLLRPACRGNLLTLTPGDRQMPLGIRSSLTAGKHALMRLAFVALASLCLVAMAAPARANIVQNPGFETGDFTSWTQTGWGINGSVPPHTGNFDASTGCVGAPCVDPTNPNAASL